MNRLLTDTHPPAFYVPLYIYTRVLGDSDFSLRLFSALCATSAVVVFLAATGRALSVPARLFGGALATSSAFWFYQAQNARDYSFSMLCGSILAALCVRILLSESDDQKRRLIIFAIAPFSVFCAFVHFYLMFVSLAVLSVLFLFVPKQRIILIITFLAVFASSAAYVKFVIDRYSQFNLVSNWIPHGYGWIFQQLKIAATESLNRATAIAVIVCLAVIVLGWRRTTQMRDESSAAKLLEVRWLKNSIDLDWLIVLGFGVPLIANLGGIVSSMVISPNVTDRNLLVCSPFLWLGFARIYDLGPGRIRGPARTWIDAGLALLLLVASSVVVGRALPSSETFREGAQWIRDIPACRSQPIPVISMTDPKFIKPGFMPTVVGAQYGYYLQGFAPTWPIDRVHIADGHAPAGLGGELARRLDGEGCPVLGWVAHDASSQDVPSLEQALLIAAGRPKSAGQVRIQDFAVYKLGFDRRKMPPTGFILFADRGGR